MNLPLSNNQILSRPHILVIENNKQIHRHFRNPTAHYQLTVSKGLTQAIDNGIFLNGSRPDVTVIDVSRTRASRGIELCKELRHHDKDIPILLVTQESSEDFVIEALRTGITDLIKEPFTMEECSERLAHCLQQGHSINLAMQDDSHDGERLEEVLVGSSSIIHDIRTDILKVAKTESNVLITGETGTGKEVVARAIHQNSFRCHKAFVCVNCAAIPDTLLESELFGYERGAFTGAYQSKRGKLEQAQDGTILFDEIGDMELSAQAKVLRAIEERQIHRLGGGASYPLNIRVVAVTNKDLEHAIEQKQFRSDLFYRLNVARIHLPSLRQRKEDIPSLVQHFIREFNPKFHREVEDMTTEALESLLNYSWPGNVRELRNLIEASFIHLPTPTTRHMNLPPQFRAKEKECADLPQTERDRILSALLTTKWSRTKAAKKLKWSRMTLYRKMAKHNIGPRSYKVQDTHSIHTNPTDETCNIL